MSLYERHILPHVVHLACGSPGIAAKRRLVVPHAAGRVLEIGMGSGHNLAFYNPDRVEHLWGLEPSEGMRRRAARNLERSPVAVEWLDLPSESIPLADSSADTVVLTFTLCSILSWEKALGEMRRVLKPQGQLLFCEHGRHPEQRVQKWQDRLNPLWKKLAGGCHLNRDIPVLLRDGGFHLEQLEQGTLSPGPHWITWSSWGRARPR